VAAPENSEEVSIRANRGVELDPNNLGVLSGTGANQLVSRIGYVTLRVPDLCFDHSLNTLKGEFHSPEAPGTELGEF
jgi:hypothetical protein